MAKNFVQSHHSTMCPRLPNELWLEIFQWVTYMPSNAYASTYSPFCDSPAKDEEGDSLKIKRALVLVCRLWRALTTDLLYKDLQITQGSCQSALCRALTSSRNEQGYGRLVRLTSDYHWTPC